MIVEATMAHVFHVIRNMRTSDRESLKAVWGDISDYEFAKRRWEIDGARFTMLVDGIPIAVLGVQELGYDAVIWMVATDAFDHHWRSLYAATKKMVQACFEAEHTLVLAFVMEGFKPGEKVLRSLGFDMIGQRALGLKGELFTEFGRKA